MMDGDLSAHVERSKAMAACMEGGARRGNVGRDRILETVDALDLEIIYTSIRKKKRASNYIHMWTK